MSADSKASNSKFLKGTLILTASSIVVKVIGSLNWIILSRVLGGEGIDGLSNLSDGNNRIKCRCTGGNIYYYLRKIGE